VIGGRDAFAAVGQLGICERFDYGSTSGAGMVRYISSKPVPVVELLRRGAQRHLNSKSEP
jgi:3-phosphoglycerate kinase